MRQQRIRVESHRLVRNLASFIWVLLEVVSFVFVKADVLSAPGAGLFRSTIHSCGTCIKMDSTVFNDSVWSLPIQCRAGKTNKAHSPFLGTKYFSWGGKSLKICTLVQVNLFFLFPLGLSFSSNTAPRYLHYSDSSNLLCFVFTLKKVPISDQAWKKTKGKKKMQEANS